jgi:hypothetical protein
MIRWPLAIGVAGAIGSVVYAVHDLPRAAVAWTAAFGFGIATALGALGLAFALHLAHAKWWLPVRRPLLACAGTTPLFIGFFAPIALLLHHIYPWASPARIQSLDPKLEEILTHQQQWNNPRLFVLRAGLYLAIFTVLALLLRRVHARYDATASDDALASARRLSAVGVPMLAFAMTFAAFDWLMSMEPGFVSDMMGVYVLSSGVVAATAIFALGASRIASAKPDHVHAVGRLMLMSVIFWAYIGFFQLLLIWIANMPREIGFYRARSAGSWASVDVLLVVGRFAVPFLLLLSRPLKRSRRALSAVAWWLVLTTALEHAWFVLPSAGARLSLWDLAPFACIGGLAWAYGLHLAAGASEAPRTRAMTLGLGYESP